MSLWYTCSVKKPFFLVFNRFTIFVFLLAFSFSSIGYILIWQFFFQKPLEKTAATIVNSLPQEPLYTPQPVTLVTIFSNDHSWTATLSAARKRVIIATGDIIPARSVNTQTLRYGDFTWAFTKTADRVKDADITFINLESPLISGCVPTNEGMLFCGDPRHVEGLTYAGVDVASLANNHIGNHGLRGIESTREILAKAGIAITGSEGFIVKELKGIRFAFLGYNDIGVKEPRVSWADKKIIAQDMKKANEEADVVIVAYHWGAEYRSQPDEKQKELGRFTIDSGADVVIGNHPHWIQPVEVYKGKIITYAHGNYIFDQMWSEETKQGVIGKYTFYDENLIDVEYFPIQIEQYGQPYFLDGIQKERVLEYMQRQSEILLHDREK